MRHTGLEENKNNPEHSREGKSSPIWLDLKGKLGGDNGKIVCETIMETLVPLLISPS